MWQRFTEQARKAIFLSQVEAAERGQSQVDDTHILLGLLRETGSRAGSILTRLAVESGQLRADLESQIAPGAGAPDENLELTPSAKRVIDLAYSEARLLNNDFVGTEHLLMALIHEDDRISGKTLGRYGLDLDEARTVAAQLQTNDDFDLAPEPQDASNVLRDQYLPSADRRRFSDRARVAVRDAMEEALRFGQSAVAPEHLLLGIVRDSGNDACRILGQMNIAAADIKERVERDAAHGDIPGDGELKLARAAKRVIDLAYYEAREINCKVVGVEHLLLGLLREEKSLAGRVLAEMGGDLEQARDAVARLHAGKQQGGTSES